MDFLTNKKWIVVGGLLISSLAAEVGVADETDRQIAQIQLRMERLERAVDNQGVFEMQRQINSMGQEIQDLRGELERVRFELEELKAHQRDMFIAIDKRLQQQPSQAPTRVEPEPSPPSESSSSSESESMVATEPQNESTEEPAQPVAAAAENADSMQITEEYKTAFIMLKQRRYDEAIQAFGAFVQKYPDTKYTPNAQYWLAEAKYVTQRYEEALEAFKKVVDAYPASGKVPDARLKIGFTYYELGRFEDAKVTLNRLKAQFPNSSVAELAQQRLERISSEGH